MEFPSSAPRLLDLSRCLALETRLLTGKSELVKTCESHYWVDLDVHGFAMLARLRGFLSEARSFLMDKETLEGHRILAVPDETRLPNFDPTLLKSGEKEALILG